MKMITKWEMGNIRSIGVFDFHGRKSKDNG